VTAYTMTDPVEDKADQALRDIASDCGPPSDSKRDSPCALGSR